MHAELWILLLNHFLQQGDPHLHLLVAHTKRDVMIRLIFEVLRKKFVLHIDINECFMLIFSQLPE